VSKEVDARGLAGRAAWSVGRLQRALKRRGLSETLGLAATRVRDKVVLREEHVWYQLSLQADRPRRSLAPGLQLVQATERERELATQISGEPSPESVREFHAVGGQLWVVLDVGRPAFSCWIFPKVTPALAAPGGWLELPPGTVCLENSATSPQDRGRGIAPAAWSEIADALAGEGIVSMITKVTVENIPSRKAVAKAGFVEIAMMRMARQGTRTTVRIKPLGADMSAQLAERLDR